MRWRAYPAYRDSGVEWLGEIPEHWGVDRLKYIAKTQFSGVDKHTVDDEEPVRLCNYTDVYSNEYITSYLDFLEATATAEEIRRFKIEEGDVLVTKDSEAWNDIAVPAYVVTKVENVLCGYHLAQVRARNNLADGAYLSRAFSARGINDQFRIEATGITRYGLGKYAFENALFFVPSIQEQRSIAAFLDRETSRLDQLIAKKQRQIELLQEKRSALISHVVTKGLDSDVKMKDSGMEWLGKIPSHWTIDRLRRLSKRVTDGAHISPDQSSEDYPFVSIVDVKNGAIDFENCLRTSAASYEYFVRNDCRPFENDVLFSKDGTVGQTALVGFDRDFVVSSSLVIISPIPTRIQPGFLEYWLNGSLLQQDIALQMSGAALRRISVEKISRFPVAVPLLSEQESIVAFLDQQTSRIDQLIDKVSKSIDLLREYRTALISAAVTGKIDVREEVA